MRNSICKSEDLYQMIIGNWSSRLKVVNDYLLRIITFCVQVAIVHTSAHVTSKDLC